jgi:hypothetical protein
LKLGTLRFGKEELQEINMIALNYGYQYDKGCNYASIFRFDERHRRLNPKWELLCSMGRMKKKDDGNRLEIKKPVGDDDVKFLKLVKEHDVAYQSKKTCKKFFKSVHNRYYSGHPM